MNQTTSKSDPRIIRSKTALREALLQLMAQKPFAAISITDIVKQAKYNRGTFYANYVNKEDLLGDMISELIKDLLQAFRAPYEKVNVFSPHELHANSIRLLASRAAWADFSLDRERVYPLPFLYARTACENFKSAAIKREDGR